MDFILGQDMLSDWRACISPKNYAGYMGACSVEDPKKCNYCEIARELYEKALDVYRKSDLVRIEVTK